MIVQFKDKDVLDNGELVGYVFIFDEDDPDVEPLDEWMTLSQARELAREKGYVFWDEA